MTPYEQYISYFEDIANRHLSINWFYELDEDEILGGLRTSVKYPCMFLEIPTFGFADNRTNTDSITPSGIVVLSSCPSNDIKRRKEILISHEEIILDIIRQLRQDDKTAKLHIDTNQISYSKVGPHWDNCYGWRLDLRYHKWVDLHYKEDNFGEYNPDKFK